MGIANKKNKNIHSSIPLLSLSVSANEDTHIHPHTYTHTHKHPHTLEITPVHLHPLQHCRHTPDHTHRKHFPIYIGEMNTHDKYIHIHTETRVHCTAQAAQHDKWVLVLKAVTTYTYMLTQACAEGSDHLHIHVL